MSCDDLRGLYECWKSGELARWLADIGQDQVAKQLFKANKPQWGRAALYCLKNTLRLPLSNSDIDKYFQRTGECGASGQLVDTEKRRPTNSCQSAFNNGSPLSKPATYGSYPASPSCTDIWAERARQERERAWQEQVRYEQENQDKVCFDRGDILTNRLLKAIKSGEDVSWTTLFALGAACALKKGFDKLG